MRAFRFAVPLAASVLAGLPAAQAASFTYGSYTVVNEQVISIQSPTNVSGGVGEIVLSGSGPNAGQTLLAWCLDIYTYLNNASTYNLGTLTNAGTGGANPTLTNTQLGEIGALMANGERLINSSPNQSAATQLAIWAVEYGLPNFKFSGLSSDTVNLAISDYNNVQPGAVWAPVTPDLLSVPGSQTLGGVETPLPPTWSMLLAVLVGFGLWVRRNRARQARTA